MAVYDAHGREMPDPTPVAMPVGFQRPESLVDLMKRLIRTEVSQTAHDAGTETFEEANDFEVPEDTVEDTATQYEAMADEPFTQPEPDDTRNAGPGPNARTSRESDDDGRDGEPARPGRHGRDEHGDDGPGPSASRSADTGNGARRSGGGEALPRTIRDSGMERNQEARQRTTSAVDVPPRGHYNSRLDGADSED